MSKKILSMGGVPIHFNYQILHIDTEIIVCNTSEHPRWEESTNVHGNDNFNFGALPGGIVLTNLSYWDLGYWGYYWTSSEADVDNAIYRLFDYDQGEIFIPAANADKNQGLSIRLVRNATVEEQALDDGTIINNDYTGNDNQSYDTVKIGNQIWLIDNLKETKYNDNTDIPSNLTSQQWENDTDGAMTVYDYTLINGLNTEQEVIDAYGRHYNWYAIDNEKGLTNAGNGWRVPSNNDWVNLTDYLISNYEQITSSNIGNYLKSCRQVNSPIESRTI